MSDNKRHIIERTYNTHPHMNLLPIEICTKQEESYKKDNFALDEAL